MIICIDIGNTHIYGGVFIGDRVRLRFRYPSTNSCSSDTFGLFLHSFLERHAMNIDHVEAVNLCSVVPSLEYSVVAACKKYLDITPLQLKPGIKTGIRLAIHNPQELGADRVANAVAATRQFPDTNLVVVDFGTATTICAIAASCTYLGGAILPGLKLSMESLSEKAAKLSNIEIMTPESALGKSTLTQVQSGLVYGQLGSVREIASRIQHSAFNNGEVVRVATGGYAHLFARENFFDAIVPDLVLHGLRLIGERNR